MDLKRNNTLGRILHVSMFFFLLLFFPFVRVCVTVKEDTLLDMVEYMTSKVGLVHQMPFTCDREGFAATFEKVINQSVWAEWLSGGGSTHRTYGMDDSFG